MLPRAPLLPLLVVVLQLPLPALAGHNVSRPFAGLILVEGGPDAMVIADLCAAGVSVRATTYGERKGTPEQWARLPAVAAQAAVNADFFDFPGWSFVNGRARGGGLDWPADKQFLEPRGYWQFGPWLANLVADGNIPPLGPGEASEIISGHNIIIAGGKSRAPNFDGDQVILTAHRRTAIGVSADRRFLYLFATNAILDGGGLASAMLAAAADAQLPFIDVATNEDGGGSSQLYLEGRGQIIDSGRQVNNHLGVRARGAGPAPNCPFRPPVGWLDGVSCESARGWAQSPTAPAQSIDVHLYVDGEAGQPGAVGWPVHAGRDRPDLCQAIGSCNHSFVEQLPRSRFDGQAHTIRAYGINSNPLGPNAELGQSPLTFRCAPDPGPGVRRHIKDPATWEAWRFNLFMDVMVVGDAALAALPEDKAIEAGPRFVRSDDGAPAIYWLDGERKRHVSNPDVAAAWRLDYNAVQLLPAAQLQAIADGPPLRARPTLVKGSGPAVYLIDDPAPLVPPPPPPPTDLGLSPAPDAQPQLVNPVDAAASQLAPGQGLALRSEWSCALGTARGSAPRDGTILLLMLLVLGVRPRRDRRVQRGG